MATAKSTWSARRRVILLSMGSMPVAVCGAEKDAKTVSGLLVEEGVIEPAGERMHRLTPAGHLLSAMHRRHDQHDAGPWSLSELREYSSVRKLDITVAKEAMLSLEQRGIVAASPTKRTPKWALMKP